MHFFWCSVLKKNIYGQPPIAPRSEHGEGADGTPKRKPRAKGKAKAKAKGKAKGKKAKRDKKEQEECSDQIHGQECFFWKHHFTHVHICQTTRRLKEEDEAQIRAREIEKTKKKVWLCFFKHTVRTSQNVQAVKDIANHLGDVGQWEGKLRDSGVWRPQDYKFFEIHQILLVWSRNQSLLDALMKDLSTSAENLRNHRTQLEACAGTGDQVWKNGSQMMWEFKTTF